MLIYMGWPQMAWVAMMLFALGVYLVNHGQPRRDRYNFWTALFSAALSFFVVWSGGFFHSAHAQVPPAAAQYRGELTRAAHAQWGLGAPIAAMAAQVHQESGWQPQAVSRVGAAGMAQFMPATARWWCERNRLTPEQCQPTNPTWALRALAGYDKYLFDRTPTRYSAHDRLWVALRGYNGGLGHWSAEAASTGLAQPTRQQVDAACGQAHRHRTHCPENLGYPQRILLVLQPRYAAWGGVWGAP